MGNAISRGVGDMILKAMGWTISGALPDEKKVIVIGGPHTSNWDLILALGVMLSMGVKFSWIMKQEAFFWPLGRLWKRLGGLPIDRGAGISVVEQAKALFDQNNTLWLGLTPEGTRSKVKQYKRGYLHMAKAANVPLFIVGVDGKNKRVVFDRLWAPEGKIKTENEAIKAYVDASYSGLRPERA